MSRENQFAVITYRDRGRGWHARSPSGSVGQDGSSFSSAVTMFLASRPTGIRSLSMSTPSTTPRNSGATSTGRSCIRTRTIMSAEIRSSTVQLSSAYGNGISERFAITAASPLAGRSITTNWNLTTRKAEHLYQVHGNRGEDPTEPPAGKAYPWPAVSHESRLQHLADDFAAAGLYPFPTPLGVMLDENNPRVSPCMRCHTCDGFPCLVHAKSDAQVLCIDPALQYPNVTMLTNCLVKRLETDTSGREIRQVVVERNGMPETYSAEIVVVSCGAINSAALLLRSSN